VCVANGHPNYVGYESKQTRLFRFITRMRDVRRSQSCQHMHAHAGHDAAIVRSQQRLVVLDPSTSIFNARITSIMCYEKNEGERERCTTEYNCRQHYRE
jgi:hypothetical protein